MFLLHACLLLVWFEALRRHGSYKSELPLSYRVQNICLSLLLIVPSTWLLYGFWWRVMHPSYLAEYFYFQSGFLPPLVTFLIVSLSICAAHVELRIGF